MNPISSCRKSVTCYVVNEIITSLSGNIVPEDHVTAIYTQMVNILTIVMYEDE
jgi:hypothetical protein